MVTLIYEIEYGMTLKLIADDYDKYREEDLFGDYIDDTDIINNIDFIQCENNAQGEIVHIEDQIDMFNIEDLTRYTEAAKRRNIPGRYTCEYLEVENGSFADIMVALRDVWIEGEELSLIREQPWVHELAKRLNQDIDDTIDGLYARGYRPSNPEVLAQKEWVKRRAAKEGKSVQDMARELYKLGWR